MIGETVRLIYTDDPYTDLKPGAIGRVTSIDDTGTVFVAWQNGSTLGLVPGVDVWETVVVEVTNGP